MASAVSNDKKIDSQRVFVRLDGKKWDELNEICSLEHKKPSDVGYDAINLYLQLYSAMIFLRAVKLNPEFDSDYQAARDKLVDAIDKFI